MNPRKISVRTSDIQPQGYCLRHCPDRPGTRTSATETSSNILRHGRGWYAADGFDPEIIHALAKQDRETTVEEDIHLVESVHRGLKSRGYVPGPLVVDPTCGVNSEHSIMHLQRWMREGVDGPTQ